MRILSSAMTDWSTVEDPGQTVTVTSKKVSITTTGDSGSWIVTGKH